MIRFGTGGWRAVIGDEFIKSNIQLLTKALCVLMKSEGKAQQGIILGYDRRFLSKEAMRWCGEVFAAEGSFSPQTDMIINLVLIVVVLGGYLVYLVKEFPIKEQSHTETLS